jgi:hypothetical protein
MCEKGLLPLVLRALGIPHGSQLAATMQQRCMCCTRAGEYNMGCSLESSASIKRIILIVEASRTARRCSASYSLATPSPPKAGLHVLRMTSAYNGFIKNVFKQF